MSLFKRLFGGGETPEPEAEVYKDFRIIPTPITEGTSFRLSARIEKEIGGETKSHTLIRADTVSGLDTAAEASVDKAKQVIDALGDGIFN